MKILLAALKDLVIFGGAVAQERDGRPIFCLFDQTLKGIIP